MIRPASPCRVLLSVLMLSTLLFFTDTVSSEHEAVEVAPDHISVQPLPQHVLDYFLPTDVYGDDAHTSHIGPPVPFSPGLRAGSQRPPAKRAAWIFPRGGKIQKCASTWNVAVATGRMASGLNQPIMTRMGYDNSN